MIYGNFYKQLNTRNMTKKILQLVVILLISAQGVMGQTVQIADLTNAAPGNLEVQVDMDGLANVAAITLHIEFDSDLMDFVGITNTSLAGTWLANYVAATDKVIITFVAPVGVGYTPSGKLFDLQFYNKGGFSSDITFDEAYCEIADNNLAPLVATYTNGSLQQGAGAGTVSFTAIAPQPIGNTVDMPVTILGGTGFDAVDAFTLKIAYDEAQLAYAGYTNTLLTGVVANAGSGVLTITWSGIAEDFTVLNTLFDLQFVYYGGDAAVEFIPGCEIVNSLAHLATDYDNDNGLVTQTDDEPTLTIGTVTGTPGDAVNVAIVASQFETSVVGALTLNVTYDNSLLTYTGYSVQQLSGWVVNGTSPGVISLVASYSTGSTLDDDNVVTLDFMYSLSGGDAVIQFKPGSMVESVNLVNIPTTFVDGAVNTGGATLYTVDGQLTYMGDVDRPVGTAGTSTTTVYLKNSADSTIAYTTSTDADGNYTFTDVAAGSYFLDAITTIDASQSFIIGDAYIVYGYTVTGNGLPTDLQKLAADVNEDGSITVGDAYMIYGTVQNGYNKPSNWEAPEWIFDNVVVNVVNANVAQSFSAINSGNASGNFIPVP